MSTAPYSLLSTMAVNAHIYIYAIKRKETVEREESEKKEENRKKR